MEKHPLTFDSLPEYVYALGLKVDQLLDRLNQPTNPAPVEEAPLTVQQAADLLDVTTATVYDLVHRQRIASHRPGKRLYFLRADLLEFVKNGRRATTEELAANAASRPTRQPRKKGGKAV